MRKKVALRENRYRAADGSLRNVHVPAILRLATHNRAPRLTRVRSWCSRSSKSLGSWVGGGSSFPCPLPPSSQVGAGDSGFRGDRWLRGGTWCLVWQVGCQCYGRIGVASAGNLLDERGWLCGVGRVEKQGRRQWVLAGPASPGVSWVL